MGKNIQTPTGPFHMPNYIEKELTAMTDVALLEKYVQNCKDFVAHFLFQEMSDRKLIFDGERYQDIVERLNQYRTKPSVRQRLFVDMDGTLAVFKPVDTMEMLYQKGYFLNLTPIDNVVQAVKNITRQRPDIDVYTLSAYLSDSPYALAEKNAWLDRNLSEIDAAHRIFLPCGQDKRSFVPDGLRPSDFLLDDYTKNLNEWEPPARGIKLLNGINHTKGTWAHDRIRYDHDPQALANSIVNVMQGHAQIMDEPFGLPPVPERDFGKFNASLHQVAGPDVKSDTSIQTHSPSPVVELSIPSQSQEISVFMEPPTW